MPKIELVVPNETLPKSVDVAIIGGGIAGICAALELVEHGLKVAVFEKGEIAAEQSSRNWGWCRQMGRDPREIPVITESLKLWRDMNRRINADTGFTTCGVAYLAQTERELAGYETWMKDHGSPGGIDSRVIRGAELDRAIPSASNHFTGALHTPSDGRAEPFIAVPAIARSVQNKGGEIFTNCAVRGIETEAGRVSAVVTERGSISCRAALLAGGYWSRHFLANLGISFPQLGILAPVQRTSALENGHRTTFSGGKFAVRKRADGGFTITPNFISLPELVPASFRYFFQFLPIFKLEWRSLRPRVSKHFWREAQLKRRWRLDEQSPFELVRTLDPEPAHWILDEALEDLKKCFPAFAPMKITERWAGIIDATPDAVPVIAPIEKVSGLYLSTGYSGHGFGIGPGAGKLMAQIIAGETPFTDPKPFRFERFSDGTKPRPTTGV